jgi:hypothetical protein
MPKPRLTIYLRTSDIITIRGDILIRDDQPLRIVKGIPTAFYELVSLLRQRDVPEWRGPREEYVLLATAWALAVVGATAGAIYSRSVGSWLPPVGAAVLGGAVVAQVSFLVAPLVARRLRSHYIDALSMAVEP